MNHAFSLRVLRRSSRSTTLGVAGELDLATVPQLTAELAELSGGVLIDCTGLSFIDASGIGALVAASTRVEIQLTNVTPFVRRVLEITGNQALLAPALSPVERARLLRSRARFAIRAAHNAIENAKPLGAAPSPEAEADDSAPPDANEGCS